VLVDRHRPPYKTAGAVFLVIVSAIAAFIYLQFRGDFTDKTQLTPAVVARRPGGRTGVEGDL
jgi:phospholipid/cholesterol/gamma-HCH transport system substrate-binding protein